VLTFWHRIGLHGDDYGHVDVSGDGGTTWSELVHYTNIIESTWARKQLDLREYRTSPVLIRFRLRDNGDGAYNLLGWDIDDVEIRELFYPPLEHALIVQITNVETGKCPTIQSTVLVTDVNGVAVGTRPRKITDWYYWRNRCPSLGGITSRQLHKIREHWEVC